MAVIGAGLHGDSSYSALDERLRRIFNASNAVRPAAVLLYAMPNPNFVGVSGFMSKENSLKTQQRGACADRPPSWRSAEMQRLGSRPWYSSLGGVISLEGIVDGKLARAKVTAGGVDCSHFCMPGPVDEVARALFALLARAVPGPI